MAEPTWRRHRGDTRPPLEITLRETPAWGQHVGDPIDLAAVDLTTGVTAKVVSAVDDKTLVEDLAVKVTAIDGGISIPLIAEITARTGIQFVTVTVEFGDGTRRTLPTSGAYWLMVDGVYSDGIADPIIDPGGGGTGGDSAVEEIGEGQLLPPDGTSYIYFTVTNSADAGTPDGFYRWAGTAWVQVG